MLYCEAYASGVKLRWFDQPVNIAKLLANSGEVVVNGTFFYGTIICGLVAIAGQKKFKNYYGRPVLMVKGNMAWIDDDPADDKLANIDWAIGGGPAPLRDGQVIDSPDLHYDAGGIQPNVKRERTAVGIKPGGILVPMVMEDADARTVALRAKNRGCTDVLMLDGGGSSTWIEDGQIKFGGKRNVSTALVVKKRIREEHKQEYLQLGVGINNVQLTKNFNLQEFQDKSTGEVKVDTELVIKIQALRSKVGKPIKINSGYRTEEHNQEVGGVVNSQHRLGKAADIVVSGYSPEKIASLAEEVGFRGIGIYPTFTHIDTRDQKTKWRG